MRIFDYTKLSEKLWDMDVVTCVAKIHEYRGKQKLLVRQEPTAIIRLAKSARIQSTESSNKIEGIMTTGTRMKQLLADKITPKSLYENEIVGYWDVLNTINENYEFIPVTSSSILQLHRDLLKYTGPSNAGHYKNTQNYINETRPDGTVFTRFTPVAPYEAEAAMEAICSSYAKNLALEKVDPLILIPAFICDFLCIHPFNDGNGRMSRLLTLLLLYQNGYEVGKYISVERQIEKTKDAYYESLHRSDQGWLEEKNNPTPFIKYMLQIILACYTEFEEKLGAAVTDDGRSTAYEVVKNFVSSKVGKFSGADVMEACPAAGRSSVLQALKKLTDEGMIIKMGSGRSTFYVRSDAVNTARSQTASD